MLTRTAVNTEIQPTLDEKLQSDGSGRYVHLEGVPKALLPGPGGKKILDHWWDIIKNRQLFAEVYLVTNADKFKHFERWATASEFPAQNVINDGTTSYESRLGAVADLELALRTKKCRAEDVLVIAGDMLFQDQKFDINQVTNYFASKRPMGDLAIYYELEPKGDVTTRGIIEICPNTNQITRFFEKPSEDSTASRKASVVFYCFRSTTLKTLERYLSLHSSVADRSFGKYMEWLINEEKQRVYAMKLPTGFQLIGHTTLKGYEDWVHYFSSLKESRTKKITKRVFARVGLMGNPSDGFNGKTISLSIKNFWAEVTILESPNLVLVPHPLCDPTEFGSLADLYGISSKEGYLGGLRLLQATCKKFHHYCSQRGIALAKRNFTLKYDTNIPRQVGLAGSSAIVTATLQCLMAFFNLNTTDIPKELQPQFILEVEVGELFINAGLQDRVVQVYEGLVYMDFSLPHMSKHGHGLYENLHPPSLPDFFIAYKSDPSDSGKIHCDVRQRFDSGDSDVTTAMAQFADLTTEARSAIEGADWQELCRLMNKNFELRRTIYGEECLGAQNLRMIEIGRKFGAACKFPGSGGAVLGLLLDKDRFEEMCWAYQNEEFVVTSIFPNNVL